MCLLNWYQGRQNHDERKLILREVIGLLFVFLHGFHNTESHFKICVSLSENCLRDNINMLKMTDCGHHNDVFNFTQTSRLRKENLAQAIEMKVLLPYIFNKDIGLAWVILYLIAFTWRCYNCSRVFHIAVKMYANVKATRKGNYISHSRYNAHGNVILHRWHREEEHEFT